MTIPQFMTRVQEVWGRTWNEEQARLWKGKLLAFTEGDRDRIFEWLTDHCKWLPGTKDLWDAATDLGIYRPAKFQRSDMSSPFKTDRVSRCKLCSGTGFRYVYNEISMDGEGRLQRRFRYVRPSKVLLDDDENAITESGPLPLFMRKALEEVLYRCNCEAGDRQPKCLSRLRSEAESREVREQHEEIPF